MKLLFISIPLFSLSGISSWVVYPRFVTDFDFFFQKDNFITNSSSISSISVPMYQEEFHYRIIGNSPRIAASRHRKQTKSTISSNPQS